MWSDPQQCAEGHYCAKCLREIFGNDILCPRCLDRLAADAEFDYE
jgi:hypothetical protein